MLAEPAQCIPQLEGEKILLQGSLILALNLLTKIKYLSL